MEPDQSGWTPLEIAVYEMARWFEPLGVRAMTFVLQDGTVKVTVRDQEIARFKAPEGSKPEAEAD